MTENDRPAFLALMKGIHALHRQPLSDPLLLIYWNACAEFTIEQVTHACNVLTRDAERGKFIPKPGDITFVIEGTSTDRAMIAWGKVLEGMQSVGAYRDVVFDDAAIHAAVLDMGGWPKMCRGDMKDISYLQTAFTKAHKAYTGRGTFDYPRSLPGDRSPDSEYIKAGLPVPEPVLIGDRAACRAVYLGGGAAGKTAITFTGGAKLLAALPRPPAAPGNDADFLLIEGSK